MSVAAPGSPAQAPLRLLDLRGRWQRWWAARLQPVEQHRLTQRTIYIVPTRAGLAFGLTLLLLLVASMNYQLSLGFALTFLLGGSALASIHLAHASLRGLSLHLRPPQPVFAGEAAGLEVVITNPGAARHGLGLGHLDALGRVQLAWVEVAARQQTPVHLAWLAPSRGVHALPVLRLESRFPFGLFVAWSVWRPAGELWVWPAPEHPCPPVPEGDEAGTGSPQERHRGAGEFDGVRAYRRGDPPRQILWKKAARTGELVSRDLAGTRQQSLHFELARTGVTEREAGLSRVCAWVLAADAAGHRFSLHLPGADLPLAEGPAHRVAALQALSRC